MWDWPFFAAIVMGVARAVDRAGGGATLQQPWARCAVLAWWLAIAAFQADSVEGFAVLALVPLGAYKVADVVAGAVLAAWGRLGPSQ
jgi:hypothetical protein